METAIPGLTFGGETFSPRLDRARLSRQFDRVRSAVIDGGWYTLGEVQAKTGDPQASISSRLRDFRKPQFGGHTLNTRRTGDASRGLYEYQLIERKGEV